MFIPTAASQYRFFFNLKGNNGIFFFFKRGPYTSKYRCTDESYVTKVLEFKVDILKIGRILLLNEHKSSYWLRKGK